MTYRCGVIGCGVISQTHLDVIDHHPDLSCVALCDIREDRLQKAALGRDDVFLTSNYKDLLNPSQIDILFVLTDHASHSEIAIDVLKSGINLICEKPVTAHADQLSALMAAIKDHPKVLAGGIFQNRFNPHFALLKKWISEGELGTLLHINLLHNCYRSEDYYNADAWRGKLKSEGGSAMINQSIHFIDYMIQLGGEVQTVAGFQANLAHGDLIETEDTFSGVLTFKSGPLGAFTLTNGSHQNWAWRLQCSGTKGTVTHDAQGLKLSGLDHLQSELDAEHEKSKLQSDPSLGKSYYGGGHFSNIDDYVKALQSGRLPNVTLESAGYSTSVVHALYGAAREQKVVMV